MSQRPWKQDCFVLVQGVLRGRLLDAAAGKEIPSPDWKQVRRDARRHRQNGARERDARRHRQNGAREKAARQVARRHRAKASAPKKQTLVQDAPTYLLQTKHMCAGMLVTTAK